MEEKPKSTEPVILKSNTHTHNKTTGPSAYLVVEWDGHALWLWMCLSILNRPEVIYSFVGVGNTCCIKRTREFHLNFSVSQIDNS